ncbi:MAG: hypothetical protein K0S47_453 [Herbinix sp.]|jgi:hypothetical protein|nr:hypothetical protein [Herbinix sp.]
MKDIDCYIEYLSEQYKKIKEGTVRKDCSRLPGNTYFLEDSSILCIPRSDGDNRFPYGQQGFNFWAYASGYMHANEGLFSPFLRASEGQEPKIAFFAGFQEKEHFSVLSLLAVPNIENSTVQEVDRYTVFTKTCVYYITEAMNMRFALRVFIDDQNHMYFTILGQNLSKRKKRLYFSSYINPYLCTSIYENAENQWFRKAEFVKGSMPEQGTFIFRINEDLSRTVSVTNYGVINRKIELGEESHLMQQEASTSRYQFVGGVYSSLHTAIALKAGTFHEKRHITAFNDIAIAGELMHLEIAPEKSFRVDTIFRYSIHSKHSQDYKRLVRDIKASGIDELVHQYEVQNALENQLLRVAFGEGINNSYDGNLLTHFFTYLKKQVEFCAGIKGYAQLSLGSLIGIRDIFQAIEGMLFIKPDQARNKMVEALGFITPEGRCPRQYSLPVNDMVTPAMDLRQFIDQGAWVINTIITYLKFTGDFALLDQVCGYYEILDDKKNLVKKSDKEESVLLHMLHIMDYFIANQDPATGCIRALYGDWNDALDGLGVSSNGQMEFGSGVSVMVTLQVYQNLQDMIELLRFLSTHEETTHTNHTYQTIIHTYENVLSRIEEGLLKYAMIEGDNKEKRIVHGWGDNRSYYVGSYQDPDGKSRDSLTSNAFWVISGFYKKGATMREEILTAFSRLDSRYGLKTFEPYFLPNTYGVGRIYKLPPGTAENGATYIHATAFGIMALFFMGEPEKAWEQLMKILPFTHERVSCSPYVMPNSYGYNKELHIDGESMLDWQTGSSNVVLKIIIRFVLGFQPEYGGFYLQPAAWIPFTSYQMDIIYQGRLIHIRYHNVSAGKRSFVINQVRLTGIYDTFIKAHKLWIKLSDLEKEVDILIED